LYGASPDNFIPSEIIFAVFKLLTITKISLRRLTQMKSKLLAVFLTIFLAVAGCSGSSNPQDQLATIDTMLAKDFDMATPQRQEVEKLVAEAKKLMGAGKTDESSKLLKKAIKVLEFAEEADRFNKSE
jgi:hypothetical protein